MRHFFAGIFYFIQGLRLIFSPNIRPFVIVPFIVNIILFSLLFFFLSHYIQEFNLWLKDILPTWLQWLSLLFWLLFFASFLIFILYAFVIAANFIAAPFNGLLSEKVEVYLTGRSFKQRSFLSIVKDVPRVLGRQFMLMIYYLPGALLLLVLFFIPAIQTLVPIAWLLFNAWFITLLYIDFPTDNHQIPLSKVRQQLRLNKSLSIGFGIVVLLAMMIPIFNFFAIPAAVAGATKLWLDEFSTKDGVRKR